MELNRALSRQHVSAYHCLQRIKQVLQQRLCLHLQPYMRRQSTSAVLIECGDKENFFELRRKNSFFFLALGARKRVFLNFELASDPSPEKGVFLASFLKFGLPRAIFLLLLLCCFDDDSGLVPIELVSV